MHTDSPVGPSIALEEAIVLKARPMARPSNSQWESMVFLREPPAFSIWLLIFLYAGVGATLGPGHGWLWIGASAAVALARVMIAVSALAPQRSARSASVLGILFILTQIGQAALWVVLLQAPASATHSPMRTATSLAAAMLLSAWCLRGWRMGWLGALVGWSAAAVLGALKLWGSLPFVSIGLLIWLPATAWAGLAPPQSRAASPARPTRPLRTTGSARMSAPAGGSTRRGVQLAIRAASAPMIGVYDGRIFDMNKSAETFLGRTAAQCLGRPAAELLKMDPPTALDAGYPAGERQALVVPQAPQWTGFTTLPVMARIQIGRAAENASIAVLALASGPDFASDRELGTDARRLADWLGADTSEAWYRDETGHLYLPKRFRPSPAIRPEADSDAFPLALLVPVQQRPYVNTLYRERVAAGQTFDERLTLNDADGAPQPVRVVCLSRPGFGGRSGAVIGIVADSNVRADVQIGRSDLLSELPVLIWLIDASGRVIHAHAPDVQRWGLTMEPRLRPRWTSALALQPGSQETFTRAVQHGLDGKPTFDLLNYRTGRSGGRLALRSHLVPFQSPAGEGSTSRAVLVMDTIASVRELLENERVRVSKLQYKDLVGASPNLIWACDAAFRFTFVSQRACRDVYGYTVEELLGATMGVLLDPDVDQVPMRQNLAGLRNNRSLRDVEMAHITKDGRRITSAVSAVALRAPDGGFGGAIGINVDVTALKQREERLAEALRVERSVLDSAGQAIAVVKAGAVARCNDAFLHLLQMRPDELAAVPVVDLFAERNHWDEASTAAQRASDADGAVAREIRVRRAGPSGAPEQFVWCQITLRAVGEGEYVIALADIDQIRRREAHAQHDARHDELTGLPNRRLLSERVRAALATSALRNSGCAILVFDLDGFKPINDRFGHPAGDLVLREIARRLQNIVRPQDTVARIGGDEFALLMPDCGSSQDVEKIAHRILRELAQPLTSSDLGGARLTASLGVVMAPEHGSDPEWLMRLADRAMYDAKVDGGDRVVFSGSSAVHASFAELAARRAS
ncbi:MAG TPA: diguanylate cyclase [Burkholderiaceae bacterium]|nr:diguanylate cyclase [Burkholderiaceae bacterium]